jgi:hypothetical protein
MVEQDHWLSITQAAERLRLTYHRVRNLAIAGQLKSKRLPPLNSLVIDARDVERLLAARGRDA